MAHGKRSGERQKASFRPRILGLALAVTVAVVAWGYLVYEAVDFGKKARDGHDHAWWFLGLATVGAVACLFVGLLLVARISRALGVTSTPEPRPKRDPTTPPGGKRAAR